MNRGRPRSGNVFKRWQGRYLDPDADQPGVFYMRYQVAGRRRLVCLHTKDRAIAEDRAAEFIGAIKFTDEESYLRKLVELGESAKIRLKTMNAPRMPQDSLPVGEVWTAYLASKRRPASGPATLRAYQGQWSAFQKWAPEKVRFLTDLTDGMAEEYARHLEGKRNPGTVNKHLGFLRLLWRVLGGENRNPWDGLHSTAEHIPVSHRRLTTAEVRRLVKYAKGEWRRLVQVGYYTGLRLVDACLLNWEQIDIHRRMIRLVPRKTARRRQAPVEIPMVPGMVAVVNMDRPGQTGPVLPKIAKQYQADRSKVSKVLKTIFVKAKVKDTAAGTASFHSFRVGWQSMADDAGVSRVITRSVLGHSGAGMSDTYSKLDLKKAKGLVSRAIKKI